MTDYEIYVAALCLIVYVMLVAASLVCIVSITKLAVRCIRSGYDDPAILVEHARNKRKVNSLTRGIGYAFSVIVFVVMLAIFLASLLVQYSDKLDFLDLPSYRVVQTGSMAEKNEKNTYLTENGLDNQIQTFDLIQTAELPDEMDLKLYDIVVFEIDDVLLVHRIVGIEEPNEYHPDCRYFKTQGDAVQYADRYPVTYDQMKAIYTGERIPYVGSFVLFMQSPAGWLCILLMVVTIIATPILERKLRNEKKYRVASHYIRSYRYDVKPAKYRSRRFYR